jgi:hypothetical protein
MYAKGFLMDFKVNASQCKVNPADPKVNIEGIGTFIGLIYKFLGEGAKNEK